MQFRIHRHHTLMQLSLDCTCRTSVLSGKELHYRVPDGCSNLARDSFGQFELFWAGAKLESGLLSEDAIQVFVILVEGLGIKLQVLISRMSIFL